MTNLHILHNLDFNCYLLHICAFLKKLLQSVLYALPVPENLD